ncbi:MAG: hypothetical protein ACLRVS_00395 [Lachnospiraceae bacterium]
MRQFSKQLSIGWMSAAGVLVIWVAAALLIAQQYRGYQEKLTMAVQVLAESEDEYTFSTLKGSNDTISQEALDMLSQYGYDGWNQMFMEEWTNQLSMRRRPVAVDGMWRCWLVPPKMFQKRGGDSAAEALGASRWTDRVCFFEEDGPITVLEELAGYLALTKNKLSANRDKGACRFVP